MQQQPPYPPRAPYPPRLPYSPYPLTLVRRPQPSPSYQRAWHWFRHAPRLVQLGLGILVVLLLLCPCASFAAVSMATSSLLAPTGVDTPASTQAVVVQDDATPTATPTPIMAPTMPVLALTATPLPTPTLYPTQTPTLTPYPTPQPTQAPEPTPCPGVNCNPWGYSFVSGHRITSPPSAFCNYFSCTPNFGNGHGYVVECHDARYSKSGGVQNACTSHGGVWRALYSH